MSKEAVHEDEEEGDMGISDEERRTHSIACLPSSSPRLRPHPMVIILHTDRKNMLMDSIPNGRPAELREDGCGRPGTAT